MAHDETPIIACCTPQGSGAIALIRISGTNSIKLTSNIAKLSSKTCLTEADTHTIHHGHVVDKHIIDEVLFLVMKAPKTFTGQDTVEISCHNNPFIINAIIQAAISHGAQHAQNGDFTKRAFLNKKIDLLQAEAIHDLINAQTELSLKHSMAQLKGTLSQHVTDIEQDLIQLLGLIESSFEFLDEEQRDISLEAKIITTIQALHKKTETITSTFSKQKQIRDGIRIALAGSTNAGKSTLFNTLLKQSRSIVTAQPGTTRDAVESTIYHNGMFWRLVDTAGLRETQEVIEQQGIQRSWYEIEQADIVLLIFDPTQPPSDLYKTIQNRYPSKVISVVNKIDQVTTKSPLGVSAKHGTGIEKLKLVVEEKIKTLFSSAQSPFMLNQRQHDLLRALQIKLMQLEKDAQNELEYELMAYHVNEMLLTLSQLTGKTVHEKLLDSVFSNFCIGK